MNKNTIKPEMTVEASNKLIAEFMGWTIEPGMENINDPYYNYSNGWQMVMASQMQFNISWDWLMPVIEKISKLNLPDPDGVSESWQPFPRTFGMTNDDTGDFMFRFNRYGIHEAPKLIDAAYSAVVYFIERIKLSEKGGSSDS